MKYLPDVLSLIGLGLLGYGLWMVAPWASFSTVGALLLLAGVSAGRRGAK